MLRAVQAVEHVVANAAPKGLDVLVEDATAMAMIRSTLEQGARLARNQRAGPINLVIALPESGQEVAVALPGSYPVGPEIRSALKAVPGVAEVAEF
jgi:DNA polymerase-3 subunit alpha